MSNISLHQLYNVVLYPHCPSRHALLLARRLTGLPALDKDKLPVSTGSFPPIAQYNLKQSQDLSAWDSAFTTLLSNVDKLNLPSLSHVLKQCGIFIYRTRKYEKYCLSHANDHRFRLLDALVNSILTRASLGVQEISDENVGILCEILNFFSKNYYQPAYRLYEMLETNLSRLYINNMELRLKFIVSLTNFTRVYGMMYNQNMQKHVINMVRFSKTLSISEISPIVDVLSPRIYISDDIMDKIIGTILNLLNTTEFDLGKHYLTHKMLYMLLNNLVKLYKINPLKRHFILQKTILELWNSLYGPSNYSNMSESNLYNITSSLHKLLVISLLHETDLNITCLEILDKILLGLHERLSIRSQMTCNWGSIGPETVRYLVILNNIKYLLRNCLIGRNSSQFTLNFEKFLKRLSLLWDSNEIIINDVYSLVLLINILGSKTTKIQTEKLVKLVSKSKWDDLDSNKLNAILTCITNLKDKNMIESLDFVIPYIKRYKEFQIETLIDLNRHNLIDLNQFIKSIDNSLNGLNLFQLNKLKNHLAKLDDHNSKTLLLKVSDLISNNELQSSFSISKLGASSTLNASLGANSSLGASLNTINESNSREKAINEKATNVINATNEKENPNESRLYVIRSARRLGLL